MKPPDSVYTAALTITTPNFYQIYPTVDTLGKYHMNEFKHVMTSTPTGLPIIFGMQVYSSFLTPDSNGYIPIPNLTTDSYLGGHPSAFNVSTVGLPIGATKDSF